MKETDGLAGASLQIYLRGSGNLNYCLKKIKKALIVLLRDLCVPFQQNRRNQIWKCIHHVLAYVVKVLETDAL